MIRVIIADDHPIVRKGLRAILEETSVFRKIDEAESGQEVIEKVMKGRYDAVLLDMSMPGMSGLETLEELRRLKSSVPVLMLSIYPEEEYAVRALKAGASGYMTKKSAPDELVFALKKICRGERYISAYLADLLATGLSEDTQKPAHEILSNRELQVMNLIVSGRSLKEIAGDMSLSPKTISTFRARILEKLNMKTNSELVQYAMKNRLGGLSSD